MVNCEVTFLADACVIPRPVSTEMHSSFRNATNTIQHTIFDTSMSRLRPTDPSSSSRFSVGASYCND